LTLSPAPDEHSDQRYISRSDGCCVSATLQGTPVLQVIAPAHYGGLEQVVAALTRGLASRGVPVHVLAFVDAGGVPHPFVTCIEQIGVSVEGVEIPPRRYDQERAHLRRVLGETGAALVHTHGTRVDVVDGPELRRLGVASVSTLHGFTGGDVKNRLYEWLQVRSVRGCDATVAVSRPIAARLAAAGHPPDRLHVIRNAWSRVHAPLDPKEARAALGIPADGLQIGWIGRLSPEKGLDVLLAALALLQDHAIGVSVIGTGPLRDRLMRRARGLASGITWHGAVANAGRCVRAFDLLILSSRSEGTPMVLFEAMDAGVPVVATSVGGVPDVVGTDEALLVPPADPGALAAGIRECIADTEGTLRRARAARTRLAAEFALEPWLDAYEGVYHAALARAARRRAERG
jgi:glycosyltransferase involved in cell wall biosynthesis